MTPQSYSDIIEIGRVLRASTDGFTCGTRSQEIMHPGFGAFVQTQNANSDMVVIGVITAIRIDDDPLVRQLIMASNMSESMLRDQRENRLVPVEIDVLNVGYVHNGRSVYNLPPRPPLSLDPVMLCTADEIAYFTERLDFLRLIMAARGIATVDLLGATIQKAAAARPLEAQHAFLIQAGRHLASALSHDLLMLQDVLAIIRPT